MFRRLLIAVTAAPEIEIGHDRVGTEHLRPLFDRVVEQALISWDVQDHARSPFDSRQLQFLFQQLGAGSVGIERLGAAPAEGRKPLRSGVPRVDCARALGVPVKLPPKPLMKLPAMEMGVRPNGLAGRPAIVLAPRFQQGVRLGENCAAIPDLKPLPLQQGLADIAHMAVARMGLRGQIGDAPGSIRLAQQDAQNGGRLRGEHRTQRTGLRAGLFCDSTLNVYVVECKPRIPEQIEVSDIVLVADGARFWRQIGADEHRDEVSAAIHFIRLAQSRHIAQQLIDP